MKFNWDSSAQQPQQASIALGSGRGLASVTCENCYARLQAGVRFELSIKGVWGWPCVKLELFKVMLYGSLDINMGLMMQASQGSQTSLQVSCCRVLHRACHLVSCKQAQTCVRRRREGGGPAQRTCTHAYLGWSAACVALQLAWHSALGNLKRPLHLCMPQPPRSPRTLRTQWPWRLYSSGQASSQSQSMQQGSCSSRHPSLPQAQPASPQGRLTRSRSSSGLSTETHGTPLAPSAPLLSRSLRSSPHR